MKAPVIHFVLFFRWYDLWVGCYIDTKARAVYICPVPMFGVKMSVVRWEEV